MTDNCLNCKHIVMTSTVKSNPYGICIANPQPIFKDGKTLNLGCHIGWEKGKQYEIVKDVDVKKPKLNQGMYNPEE
jgi:hypothetical protein